MARGATSMSRAELRKATPMVVTAGAGESTQPRADEPDPWTPDSGIRPPLNFEQLAGLTLLSGTRRSCIAAVVQNTVGLGVSFQVRAGHEGKVEGDPAEANRELRSGLDEMAHRDVISGRPDFKGLLARAKWDEQEVGQGFIEVSRNRLTGEPDGLYHVPGKRIRRRIVRNPDGRTYRREGWVMGPRAGGLGEAVRFYDFGDKVQYTDDGEPTATLKDSGRRWDVNELISFQLYTSASRDYGLPPDAHLAIDYVGDKLAAQANVGYFDNSGVPPTVIFIQGKEVKEGEDEIAIEVDPRFVRAITNTIRTGDSGARVALVPVPPGTTTQRHDLAVLSERDLGYVNFRADNRRRTLGAYRLSPIFVADIEDAGKYTAEVERALTKEQVFDPEQERWEGVLGRGLIAELAPNLIPVFEEIAIKGDEAQRESANDGADRGVVTRREYRAAHGYPPLPEAAEGAEPQLGEVETGWNDELMPTRSAPSPQALHEAALTEAEAELEKSARSQLEDEIRHDFDDAVDAAIRRIHELSGGAELRPVVVEKDGDKVVISPYGENGDGS